MRAYEKLKFYQNICKIAKIVHKITERFRTKDIRLVGQMRSSARSAKQNIREGYAKDTSGDFMRSIMIARGSLEELRGDIDDCFENSMITQREYHMLCNISSQTLYQMDRYLDSLYRLCREGKWKIRFKK